MLHDSSPVLTRPRYSSIRLGLLPTAGTTVGDFIRFGISDDFQDAISPNISARMRLVAFEPDHSFYSVAIVTRKPFANWADVLAALR